jgi:hypothetical protein
MSAINTHHLKLDFGKHKDQLYTRVPVNYLLWMVNIRHSKADIAQAELDRRGTVLPQIDISGHAVDRASISCRKIWHETKREDEGLHAWLCRLSIEAIKANDCDEAGRYRYAGMKFAVEIKGVWPVLLTCMPDQSIKAVATVIPGKV